MSEPVLTWWARRQFTHACDVPYPIGRYREAWASFPVLIRQYHPDLNHGIMLSQIPPAAEVLLCWQCDSGHIFVATPEEQRSRPGRERRRSSWCPECLTLARPPRASPLLNRSVQAQETAKPRKKSQADSRRICAKTPPSSPGEAFVSACAPAPASAVEARLRHELAARLEFTEGMNAVRVTRPFFDHVEVWPDIVLPELKVAIEYDSTGRHGLEHVGRREATDRRKDRALRAVGWEVVRVRDGKLPKLGPHDLIVQGLTKMVYPRLIDELRVIRGDLFVNSYLRSRPA
jgi:hypothetical protein